MSTCKDHVWPGVQWVQLLIVLSSSLERDSIYTFYGCPVPCAIPKHETDIRTFTDLGWGNITGIFVVFGTTDVSLIEEKLLFDFNAIISSLGGSLGLFLGFSCLDGLKWIRIGGRRIFSMDR